MPGADASITWSLLRAIKRTVRSAHA